MWSSQGSHGMAHWVLTTCFVIRNARIGSLTDGNTREAVEEDIRGRVCMGALVEWLGVPKGNFGNMEYVSNESPNMEYEHEKGKTGHVQSLLYEIGNNSVWDHENCPIWNMGGGKIWNWEHGIRWSWNLTTLGPVSSLLAGMVLDWWPPSVDCVVHPACTLIRGQGCKTVVSSAESD